LEFAKCWSADFSGAALHQANAANAGPDTVYYATKLRGASNQKAKGQLAFRPRPLEWLGAQTSAAV
jgi:hypothetical protein